MEIKRIFIAGSMSFAQEIVNTAKTLQTLGYETAFAPDTYDCIKNSKLNEDENHGFATDIMRACMKEQEQCEAILVLNYDKEGQKGYLGAHTLIELGLAYYLKQKIFLLQPLLSKEEVRYATEIMHMKPIILEGNIQNIQKYL